MKKKIIIVSLFVVFLFMMFPMVSVIESKVVEKNIKSHYAFAIPEIDITELKNKDNNNSREPLVFILFILKQIVRLLRIFKLWFIWKIIKEIISNNYK